MVTMQELNDFKFRGGRERVKETKAPTAPRLKTRKGAPGSRRVRRRKGPGNSSVKPRPAGEKTLINPRAQTAGLALVLSCCVLSLWESGAG